MIEFSKLYLTQLSNISNFSLNKNLKFFSISIFTLLTLVLSYFIVHNSNWTFGDDFQFIITTASGKYISFENYIAASGRFWPLGHFDYNLLTFLNTGGSAYAHYIWSAINFIVFSFIVFILIIRVCNDKISTSFSYFIGFLVVVSLVSRFYPVFLSVIFPERIILVLLSLFLFSYYGFVKTNKPIYVIVSLFLAVYLSYCKEPISGVFFVIALTQLIFNYKGLSVFHRRFCFVLIGNFVLFLLLYYFLVFRSATGFYGQSFVSLSKIELISTVLRAHKIFIFSTIILFFRLYFILFRKQNEHLFFDALIFAASAYVIVLIFLNMIYSYYYFPAVFLVFVSLVYFSTVYIKKVVFIVSVFTLTAFVLSLKLPSYVQQNQQDRAEMMPKVIGLVDQISLGKTIVWYDNPNMIQNEEFLIMSGWEKIVIESFIGYILDNPNYKIDLYSNLSDANKCDYLLYSHYGDTDSAYVVNFQEIIRTRALNFSNKIGSLDVYNLR